VFDWLLTFNQGYCTWFWDGWWGDCCKWHDVAYAELAPKLLADFSLGLCIATSGTEWWQITASVLIGVLALAGVSAFGWLFYRKGRRT
jgi:hypothetical protein